MVVMKGWPATLARTLRSFRTCSTCFRRITATCALVVADGRLQLATHRRPCAGSSAQTPCPRRRRGRLSGAPATRAQRCLAGCQHRGASRWAPARTCAERLDQLEVFFAQHLGRVPNRLRLGVLVDLVGAERVLVILPAGQRLLLFLSWALHGRVVAVVQRARLRLRALLLVPVVLHRVQQILHRGRHGCGMGRCAPRRQERAG
jgi:hypothetical protein